MVRSAAGRVVGVGVLVLAAACARRQEATDVTAQTPAPQQQQQAQPQQGGLECRLTAPARVRAGEAVVVHFALENRTGRALQVLTWRSPLEGLLGNDWRITREGAADEVAYAGPMVKRGAPEAEDYQALAAGGTAEADVELTLAYALSTPGRYRVALRGGLMDVAAEGQAVPRPLAQHQGAPLACPELVVEVAPR